MKEPIFKSIFGESWNSLPPVMKKHYANKPFCSEENVVRGHLDVMCKPPLLWLAPVLKLLHQIPPVNEKNVPVSVRFQSNQNTKEFHFVRNFDFHTTKPYIFHSKMVQIKENQVAEIMRFGLCWKIEYAWNEEKVSLKHLGYALRVFGFFIPIPLTLLIGKGYAEEVAVDDNTFDMKTHITHPIWGKVYEYKGRFEVVS